MKCYIDIDVYLTFGASKPVFRRSITDDGKFPFNNVIDALRVLYGSKAVVIFTSKVI